MYQLTRSWPALAALGAALLYAAIGAGALGAPATPVGIAWLALALAQAVIGVLCLRSGGIPKPTASLSFFIAPALLWAALLSAGYGDAGFGQTDRHAHSAGSISATDAGTDAASASALASPTLSPATPRASLTGPSLTGPDQDLLLPLAPLLIATTLSLAFAVCCAVNLRRRARASTSTSDRPAQPQGTAFVIGLLIGGLALSALVTPALAATDAGRLAVPHGTHSLSAPLP